MPHKHINDPRTKFYISAIPIKDLELPAFVKYLGNSVTFRGTASLSLDKLNVLLNNVKRVPLKPWQKLEFIRTYVIPLFIYKSLQWRQKR